MPHWLQITLSVGGAIASWRWVIKPARRYFAEMLALLRQIRNNGDAIRELAALQRELAGSMVQMSVAIVGDLSTQRADLNDLRAEQRETTRLVVDLDADVRRLQKAHEERTTRD